MTPLPGGTPPFESFVKSWRQATSVGRLVVLTGAGVSAESGIPTFRGPEGYWTVGSRVYQPEELATQAFFRRHPHEVWGWYLYRWTVCRQAQPNAAHQALATLAQQRGDAMTLITQNVDGLHRRAGSPATATFEIHGNLDFMRCNAVCSRQTMAAPQHLLPWSSAALPGADEERALRCASCGDWMRPHVLWFDEVYEEEWFHSDTSVQRVAEADCLLVIGTSGATSLPAILAGIAHEKGIPIFTIDPHAAVFGHDEALHLQMPAAEALPRLLEASS